MIGIEQVIYKNINFIYFVTLYFEPSRSKKKYPARTSHVAIVMSDIHMIQQDIYIL